MSQATLTRRNTYSVDPAHSTVRFWVKHLMISKVHGELSEISGAVIADPRDLSDAEVDITISMASLSTRQDQRDAHLKGPDFLDVENFPTITFKSKRVVPTAEGEADIIGDLTLHGVTREVTLKAELSPESPSPFGGYKVGASATAVINREDFGMTWNMLLETGGITVGKEIHLAIDVELDRA
jgi:polyisoprenoid-binding protein YceI